MITVEQLLMTAREEGASDVHITVGVPPRMRVNGRIANLDYPSLSETDCSKIIYSIMDDRQMELFRDNKQIEFALSVPKLEDTESVHLCKKGFLPVQYDL